MTKPIQALSVDLRNKIAAGEVVERPASVLKELIENSIDARATSISAVVEVGGEQLIQVADNGTGIAREDLALAFERYTTSKIAQHADLFNINTLGFRGEALASIASVAEVRVESIQHSDQQGAAINFRDSRAGHLQPAAINSGTVVTVRNLFYNTPARKKFLKTPRTELRHIVKMLRRFALGHPEIEFKLTADNRQLLHLTPKSLADRIADILDPTYRKNIQPIEFSMGEINVSGFLGNLNLTRSRPGEQYIFLNGRYILDRLLNSGIYAGYQSLVKRGEYPFFVIYLTLPTNQVDVNVHPMKLEVRFKDEWRVYHVLKSGVEKALEEIVATIPSLEKPGLTFEIVPDSGPVQSKPAPSEQRGMDFSVQHETSGFSQIRQNAGLERAKSYASSLAERKGSQESFIDIDNIWQIHNKYIISQITSGLVIIDQHVAHERVLFEEALDAFDKHPMSAQTLLFPEVLEFSADEFSVLLDVLPALEKIGFRLREFGKQAVMIEAVPSVMSWGNEKRIISDILDHYLEHQKEHSSYQEAIAASFACHAAIKAGDALSKEEMQALVNQLFGTKNPYHCPHGRPIIIQLSLSELDKRFER
ncbi:MAG: DNA mismatch repair endonuclease MutL [Candidatus Marinimicrobia bacterium]|nr:DNA mismatch repair endonuclease MutL [Candidatus Neomarinimicrobiota bacterium]